MSKHSMPGWVSNGPVQINVGRDLHIHGGCGGHAALPDDVAPTRDRAGAGLGFALMRLLVVLVSLTQLVFRLVARLVEIAAKLAFTLLAGCFWLLCRSVDVLQWALRRTENACGGAPTQLVYVPTFMAPPEHNVMQLTAGNPRELAQLNTREIEYVDSN